MNIKILMLALTVMIRVAHADELANKKFRSALAVCEKALQVEMPKSYGSLSRLNSLLKRYQRSRDEALAIDPSLKDSTEQHYKGDFFTDKAFIEAYRVCEGELADKVSQAEAQVKQRESDRKARQQEGLEQSNELMEKMDLAKGYVATAINQHCVSYLRAPTLKGEAVSPLYQQYQQAKQQAIETYPEIVKQFHQAVIIDPDSGDEQTVSKMVSSWFRYCDAKFTHQLENSEDSSVKETVTVPSETEGPMLPPSSSTTAKGASKATPPVPQKENKELDNGEEIDSEYQAALKSFKGDRLKVLNDEKRLPDFVNDEDNDLQKSSEWQYEDDKKCNTYVFQGDQLTKSKVTPGECESF